MDGDTDEVRMDLVKSIWSSQTSMYQLPLQQWSNSQEEVVWIFRKVERDTDQSDNYDVQTVEAVWTEGREFRADLHVINSTENQKGSSYKTQAEFTIPILHVKLALGDWPYIVLFSVANDDTIAHRIWNSSQIPKKTTSLALPIQSL